MGVWVEPGFVVVRVRQNPSLCQEPSRVAKKNETADDGGGCVSPRPTARSYPSPTARQFGKVPLSVGVEKVSSQAIISTMVAPSHRNEV